MITMKLLTVNHVVLDSYMYMLACDWRFKSQVPKHGWQSAELLTGP